MAARGFTPGAPLRVYTSEVPKSDYTAAEDAISRLARQIDAARRSEPSLVSAEDVAALRRQGASEIHKICAEFVSSLNARLPDPAVELSPRIIATTIELSTAIMSAARAHRIR